MQILEKIMNSLNWFKDEFIKEAQNFLFQEEKRNFEIDSSNEQVLEFLFSYFSKAHDFNGKQHKGIFLCGDIGVGKSFIFETLERLYKRTKCPALAIRSVSTISLVDQTRRHLSNPILSQNDKTIYQKYSGAVYHFEDLGLERKLKHFGDEIEIMDELLLLRYKNFKIRGLKTHISTNSNLDALKKRYSPQLLDRFYGMFNIVPMNGKSRRK